MNCLKPHSCSVALYIAASVWTWCVAAVTVPRLEFDCNWLLVIVGSSVDR